MLILMLWNICSDPFGKHSLFFITPNNLIHVLQHQIDAQLPIF